MNYFVLNWFRKWTGTGRLQSKVITRVRILEIVQYVPPSSDLA